VRTFPPCIGLGPSTMVNATTTETAFSTNCTFPAGYFKAGKIVRVTIGVEGVAGSTPDSETYRVRFQTGPTNLYVGLASRLVASNTRQFGITLLIVCRAAGSNGMFDVVNSGGLDTSNVLNNLGAAMPASGVATGSVQTLQVTVTVSGSDSSNSALLRVLNVEELN
jgi:hypothetical protein